MLLSRSRGVGVGAGAEILPDRTREKTIAALVVLCASATLSACTPRTRRTPDDTIVAVFDKAIRELDPRYLPGADDGKVSNLVATGLISVDTPSLVPRLDLADKIEIVSPVTWMVTLRQGLRFSDGSLLTSDDVVYTFASAMADPSSPAYSMYNERFVRVEVVDTERVRFVLKRPLATFVTDLDMGIVSKRAALAHPGGRWPDGTCVGAGPYRVVSLDGASVVLERNEFYAGPRPPTRRLLFKGIADANARMLVMVGGSADLTQNTVRADLVADARTSQRLRVASGASVILTYLMFQTEDPMFRDVRVRQAIAYAIDREKIVRTKLAGYARLATGLLAPGHWAYRGDVARYAFDPERAKRLLDEAGYPDPDGDGPLPRFHLTYKTSADAFRVSLARVLAQQLGQVGIDVDVRPFEFHVFFDDIKRGNFQLATMQTSFIIEPDMYSFYFRSDKIPTAESPNQGGNRSRYHNADVDAWIEAGRQELDAGARKAIYARIQQQLAQDVPIVPLWHEDNIALMNVDLDGFAVLPTARLSTLASAQKRGAGARPVAPPPAP